MADLGVVIYNLDLRPGHCVEIKGFIPEGSARFAVNMGTDPSNYVLHFNPRFNYHGVNHRTICNAKQANVWGKELRYDAFPFKQGTETSFCIEYQTDKFVVKLPSGEQFSFPVRMHLDAISYLAVEVLQMTSITVE